MQFIVFTFASSNRNCKSKADAKPIFEILQHAMTSKSYKTWSNLDLISTLLNDCYFLEVESTVSKSKTVLHDFWVIMSYKAELSSKIRARVEKLKSMYHITSC